MKRSSPSLKARTKTDAKRPRGDAFAAGVLAKAREIVPCYTIVVSVDERGHFMARALEVETSFASGKTQEEAIANLRESLMTLIASMIEDGEQPPQAANVTKRDEQINIRLTAMERLRLEQAARAHGYRGLSDFVRIAALKAAS